MDFKEIIMFELGNLEKMAWVAVAGVAGYNAYDKKKGEINYILAGVAAFALLQGMSSKEDRDSPLPPNVPVPVPPGQTIDTYKVNSIVQQLRSVLNTALYIDGSDRCEAYERFYKEPTDAEFITIHNKYKNDYNKTIREQMNNTNYSGCSYFYTQWDDKVIERLNSLNL